MSSITRKGTERDAISSPKFKECQSFLQYIIFFWGPAIYETENFGWHYGTRWITTSLKSRTECPVNNRSFFFPFCFASRNRASWVCLSTCFKWYQLFPVSASFIILRRSNLFMNNRFREKVSLICHLRERVLYQFFSWNNAMLHSSTKCNNLIFELLCLI